jgi:glycosyltransferase involved in cell wall biosynthesis
MPGSLPVISVFFDTQAFRLQRIGGISRYFAELIRRLPVFDVAPSLHMPWVDNEHAVTAGLSSRRGRNILNAHPRVLSIVHSALRYGDSIFGATGHFDILHRTYYSETRALRRPVVCTVVDMIPELFPAHFPKGNPHERKREVVQGCDLVLSISESTSRDVVELYGYPAERVVTIPLGIDLPLFSRAPRLPNPFRRPYVLFVGNRDGYKNFGRFGTAVSAVLAARPDLSLAVVGGGALRQDELELFSRSGVLERVKQARITDAALPTIYRDAELFVFPSEYEGFGLPLLESFACDCPVAASRTSSLPEVGGEAIEYFDPTSGDDIGHAMERVLGSPTRASELRRLGSERVRTFSWERTAELTAAAYRRLC